MGSILKRIYMENFKLFERRTITFENVLTVFDGPNGYGKTSTFDAIELLITGEVGRMKASETVQGNVGYGESFLAKDQSRDVVVKGEFINTETGETLVIIRRIPNGITRRDNNPQNIFKKVKTEFPSQFDNVDGKGKNVSQQAGQAKFVRFFGGQSGSLYTLLNYLQQEDRLSFFKQSEKERTNVIEKLLGLEEHRQKLDKAQHVYNKLNKEYSSRQRELESLRGDISRQPRKAAGQTMYEPLAERKPMWDKETLGFRGASTSDFYQRLMEQVDGVKALFLHRSEFEVWEDTRAFREIPTEERGIALLAWKLQFERENAIQEFQTRQKLRTFCRKQNEYIQKSQFVSVQWMRVCNILGVTDMAEGFTTLANRIKESRMNQNDLQKTLTEIDRTRNQLHQQFQNAASDERGVCPYCGHDWGDAGTLDAKFTLMTQAIQAVMGREAVNHVLLVEECKNQFQQKISVKWSALMEALEQDVTLDVFCHYSSWQAFQNAADACEPIMDRLHILPEQVTLGAALKASVGATAHILEQVEKLWTSLPAEYMALDQKYGFRQLYQEGFDDMTALEGLSVEKLERKKQYIHDQFYYSFDESIRKLNSLEEQQKVRGQLCDQLYQYVETLKKAINTYRKQLIGQIEIPFFLYSSRLLQSYPGGQGVLIDSQEGEKMRFTAPGREHDVLYTMSSGQLSAVLLAFSLSLNQIYARNGFQTLLIDDPIQCMDDINMVSLVELLGREFSQSQVIISTHEDDFARFIGYKYGKYGLSHKSVSLKHGC